MSGRIDIGHGCFLREATAADLERIHAKLREEDRIECERSCWNGIGDFERCWVVADGGGEFGYVGFCPPCGASVLSCTRVFAYHSTKYAAEHPLAFARMCREGFAQAAARMPEWVDCVVAFADSTYAAARRWLERMMGFRPVGEVDIGGNAFTVYARKRGGRKWAAR